MKTSVSDFALPPRHQWLLENKIAFRFVFFFALAGEIFSLIYYINWMTFLCLIPIGGISFGYTVPFIKTKRGWIRLRDIRGLKIFLITLVLGLVTVVLPVVAYANLSALLRPEIIFIFIRRMLFIFAITIPFDIRDVDYDRQNNIETLPVLFGIPRAKKMAIYSLAAFAGCVILQLFILPKMSSLYAVALIISIVPTSISILKTKKSSSDYFFSFAVEGMMIVQCFLIIAAYIIER
ncbi:MAG: UbiA family prenyltransferase [Bacteroidia bacterium]